MPFFKDKALQVTMVKRVDGEIPEFPEQSLVEVPPETIEKIGEVTQKIIRDIGKIGLLYIAADTARKVIVELSKK